VVLPVAGFRIGGRRLVIAGLGVGRSMVSRVGC
jgi:hypothetical protein